MEWYVESLFFQERDKSCGYGEVKSYLTLFVLKTIEVTRLCVPRMPLVALVFNNPIMVLRNVAY